MFEEKIKIKFERDFSIYIITNLKNGMQYIGQVAGHTIENRLNRHFSDSRNGRGYELHNSMRIYGEENFIAEHICSCSDLEELNKQEINFIKIKNTLYPFGYNKTKGGAPHQESLGKEITFKGKRYISLSSLARKYRVKPHVFMQRITKYSWSVPQALELEEPPFRKPSSAKQFKVNEEIFDSFREACKNYKLNEGTIRSRLIKGWTKSQAFNFESPPKRKSRSGISFFVDDKYFETIIEACKFFNVNRDLYFDRKKRGWTTEQIFGVHTPPPKKKPNAKVFKVGGKFFSSMESATQYYGLYQHAISFRLKAGWTPEEACGLVKRIRVGNYHNAKPITVEGIKYSSISKASQAYDLRHQRVFRRLKAGWSVNQAFGLETHPLMRLELSKSKQKKT